ncbi:MAG: TPM domain-containing protein [Nitrospiraceae bacterium]
MWRVKGPRSRRLVEAVLLVLLCVLPAQALDVPPFSGWIVDQAKLLSAESTAQLTEHLRAHEQKTGNQVAVLTVPSLQGESVEDVAQHVFVAWDSVRRVPITASSY